MPIIIPVAADDEEMFLSDVQKIASGVVRHYTPHQMIVIKINNWFGPRWLRFAGKMFFGIFGVGTWKKTLTIPPFVPERVVWQKRFSGEPWEEIEPGQPLHRDQPSSRALKSRFSKRAPDTAILWFSGNSAQTGRGSVMLYLPDEESNPPWYASWGVEKHWSVSETKTISPRELTSLMRETSGANVI